MKFFINKLEINTASKGTIPIKFESFNYFYGEINTGKSTIVRLIDFCFGGKVENLIPVLQNEFESAVLYFGIDEYEVRFKRNKGEHKIEAYFRKSDEEFLIQVPIESKNLILIPDTEVENLSDLLFFLSGIRPPKVKSSNKDESPIIRLSFRDILFYCYLNQEEMDNTLFYLDRHSDVRHNKAIKALEFIFGIYDINLSDLEIKLKETQSQKNSSISFFKQLTELLLNSKFESTSQINNEIESLNKKIQLLEQRKSQLKITGIESNNSLINDLRSKSFKFSEIIDKLNFEIKNYYKKVDEQTKLLHEYQISKVRFIRSDVARQILRDVAFVHCPQCGNDISKRLVDKSLCFLCSEPLNSNSVIDAQSISSDLSERINELSYSITKLKGIIQTSEKDLAQYILENQKINIEINRIRQEYDSNYLALASHIEREIGEIHGTIETMSKFIFITERLRSLKLDIDALSQEEIRLRNEIIDLKKKLAENRTIIDKFKVLLMDTLLRMGVKDIDSDQTITLDNKYCPEIINSNNGSVLNFANVGSGGTKGIFKTSFAIALQRLVSSLNINMLPSFLILDTPTKSIGDLDAKIINAFFNTIYELAKSELKNTQIIVLDNKEYIVPTNGLVVNVRKLDDQHRLIPR